MDGQRLPPHSKEAERSLLGCCLRLPKMISEVVLIVGSSDFYIGAHQMIWDAILTLQERNHHVDLVMVSNVLRERGQLKDVGGYEYLGELWEAMSGTGYEAVRYAEIVRDNSMRRATIHACAEITREAYEPTGPAAESVERAEREIFLIAERGVRGESVSVIQAMRLSLDRLDRAVTREEMPFVSTGFMDLDSIVGGLHCGELIVVAARPSAGKTAFALATMKNIAMEGKPLAFCSLEQSAADIGDRLLSMESGIDSHKIRTGTVTLDECQVIQAARDRLARMPLDIFDVPDQTLTKISAYVRRQCSKLRIEAAFIDYLGLIEVERWSKRLTRNDQIGEITKRLKWLARETNRPVVLLAQLNREIEKRSDPRPRLSDIRESGNVEQDADTVLLLYYDDDEPGILEINVAKQRNGRRGKLKLAVQPRCYRYSNAEVMV